MNWCKPVKALREEVSKLSLASSSTIGLKTAKSTTVMSDRLTKALSSESGQTQG